MSRYWQHESPLSCPDGHAMYWLGSVYWICCECHRILVQTGESP